MSDNWTPPMPHVRAYEDWLRRYYTAGRPDGQEPDPERFGVESAVADIVKRRVYLDFNRADMPSAAEEPKREHESNVQQFLDATAKMWRGEK